MRDNNSFVVDRIHPSFKSVKHSSKCFFTQNPLLGMILRPLNTFFTVWLFLNCNMPLLLSVYYRQKSLRLDEMVSLYKEPFQCFLLRKVFFCLLILFLFYLRWEIRFWSWSIKRWRNLCKWTVSTHVFFPLILLN